MKAKDLPLHTKVNYKTWKVWVTDKSPTGTYCMSKDKQSGVLLAADTEILIKNGEYIVL